MSFSDLILILLEKQKLDYEILRAPDAVSMVENWLERTVPLGNVARLAILLKAILTAQGYQLDNSNGIQVIIDDHLTSHELIHFEAPQACTLFRVKSIDLQHMAQDILLGYSLQRVTISIDPAI